MSTILITYGTLATAGLVGLMVVALPLAYGYHKSIHFGALDEHLFVGATLLGLVGTWLSSGVTGVRPHFSWVQIWGAVLVAVTCSLHALNGLSDVPRVVTLVLLSLAWPSVAALAVRSRARPWLMGAVGAAVLGQSGLAGYQFLANAHQSLFTVGTLFNAGSLGNYLALALPWLLSVTMSACCAAFARPASKGSIWLGCGCYYYVAVTVAAAVGLALTGARAAWLGALAGVGLVLGREWGQGFAWRIRRWWAGPAGRRLVSLLLLGGMSSAGLWALVRFKEASVYGRWQIYTIGVELYAQHPVLGIGWGRAASQFNEQQAAHFATRSVPIAQQVLATDTYLLFNSLLQLGIEAGVAGLATWVAGLGFLGVITRRSYREKWTPEAVGAAGALLSVGVSSLFSYPFQVLPVVALAGIMLGWLPASQPAATAGGWKGRLMTGGVLALVVLGVGYGELRRWRALQCWQRAAALAQQQAFGQAVPLYEQAWPALAGDGAFLYNYGVEAGLAGLARRSITLLEAARPHYTSSALYSYLGQAYEDTGRLQQAAWCYQHASYMVPAYFYPRYRLFELYRTMGQPHQARRVGWQLLAYPVKIDTDLAWQIKYNVEQALRTDPALRARK